MKRSEYRQKLEQALHQMDANIDELETKLDKAKLTAKDTHRSMLDDLKSKRDIAKTKLKQFGNATDAAWSEVARGAERAWKDLAAAYDRARSQFVSAPPVR